MNMCKNNDLLDIKCKKDIANEVLHSEVLEEKVYIHLEHIIQLTDAKKFCEDIKYLCLLLQNNLDDILAALGKKCFSGFFNLDFSDLAVLIDALDNRINSENNIENHVENLKLHYNKEDSFNNRFNYGFYYQCLPIPLKASCLLDKILNFFDIYYIDLIKNYDRFRYNTPSHSVLQSLKRENSSALGAVIVDVYVKSNSVKF